MNEALEAIVAWRKSEWGDQPTDSIVRMRKAIEADLSPEEVRLLRLADQAISATPSE